MKAAAARAVVVVVVVAAAAVLSAAARGSSSSSSSSSSSRSEMGAVESSGACAAGGSLDASSASVFVPVATPTGKVVKGRAFPLVLGPASAAVAALSVKEITEQHHELLLRLARDHGAVMLRGFNVQNPQHFYEIVTSLGIENMPYLGGAAVRRNIVGDIVFTANESPPSEPIPFHHEMAQVLNPPRYVMFYCEVATTSGGETPLILSELVYEFLCASFPAVCARIEELGVKYTRSMPSEDDATSAIGRSWRNTFLVSTAEEAEAKMRSMGHTWEWLPNGDLRTTTSVLPAVRSLPGDGSRRTFFNSIVAAFKGWVDSRNDPLKAVQYGDGRPLEPEVLEAVFQFMEREKVATKWAVGDVILIDNFVAMHSRNTYDSPRRVLAAVGRAPLGGTYASSRALKATAAGGAPVTTRLYGGDFMPRLGLGLWKVPRAQAAEVVVAAIRAGVRHLDCAADYGNEKEVGDGIRAAIAQGLVKREDLFVVSKLWNTYHGEHVEAALNRSLADLQLDYVDLYMIHFPIAQKFVPFEARYPPEWFFDPKAPSPRVELSHVPIRETWRGMEDQVVKQRARSIGVCNFNVQQLRDMFGYAKLPPAVLQVELHPLLSQDKLLRFAAEKDIKVVAFSPFGPASYVEIGMASAEQSIATSPVVAAIAKAHKATPQQVMLRWALQRGTGAVFKSSQPAHIASNLGAFKIVLSAAEMDQISRLNQNKRFNDPGEFALKAFNTFLPIYE